MVRFTTPPARGEFNRQVWEIVRQVPAGKVTTYGFIAGLIPPPGGMDPGDYRAWGRAGWAAPWQLARRMSPGSALSMLRARSAFVLEAGGWIKESCWKQKASSFPAQTRST